MQRKPTNEELAQMAIQLLDQAEILESEKNWPKAIENYTNAAEYLKQSGYLQHRIEDIYTRITDLNNYIQQDKALMQQTQVASIEQLQDQGFALLDAAKKLESEGRLEDAIQQYMSAISLLAQAGWTETQLDNIKGTVIKLGQTMQRQQQLQQQSTQQPAGAISVAQPQGVTTADVDPKAAALKAYEAKKKQEEDMQNEAFALIDQAKTFEQAKQFDGAIANYEKAIGLLNTLGWTQQTQNMGTVVEKLKRDKMAHEAALAQRAQQAAAASQASTQFQASMQQAEPQLREMKLLEFEAKKKQEEKIQTKAFNLIDIGKRFEREKKYDEAITQFEESISLLKSINWDSYIQPVITFINDIKLKKQKEVEAEQIRAKRQTELTTLQQTIQAKQKEQFVQSAQESELKRREFEQKRQQEIQKEKEFFAVLDNADKTLQEGDYDTALGEYGKALDILSELGTGWENYIPAIQSTITTMNQRKLDLSKRELEIQKKKTFQDQKEQEFQQQIAEQLKEEREKLKQKALSVKEREDELQYRQRRKDKAFKYLDSAQDYIKQTEYDKAIYAYQNAANIFAEIQWLDEIPIIENSIRELIKRRDQQKQIKQGQLQKQIESREKDKEFQKQIARQLREEREAIKQKEVQIKERDAELKRREERKNEAFKLFDEAQKQVSQGEFDKAIEIYHQTANIFAEIQWQSEIDLIQNSIIEIENMKREAEIRKQQEMQAALAREKQDRTFQEQISKEMEFHSDKLKEREIQLREREKEIEFREAGKDAAFELLDEAQGLLKQGKFDESLNLYHEVANIFAQIQWTDEIPVVQEAIRDIENKKREKELWKQRSMTEAIQKETSHRAFSEQIKQQRNIEKSKLLEKQNLAAERQKITAQIVAKQQEAFKAIEKGDSALSIEQFDDAIQEFQKGISLLTEIGWEESYLKLLKENLQAIEIRKQEKAKAEQQKQDNLLRQQEEQEQFQKTISDHFLREKERMKVKKIEVQKREAVIRRMETRKTEAFKLLDQAEKLMIQGQYEESVENYRQAELILNEIQYPTDAISEMISKVLEKKREQELLQQQQMELQLKRQHEDSLIQQQIAERMKAEQDSMKLKQIQLQKQDELRVYLENRKNEAFNLLEEAESFMNRGQYEKSLEYYRDAELKLNELQFPTEAVRQMIVRVQEKKREQELIKQREMDIRVQREKEEMTFQSQINEEFKKEKGRLKIKQIQVQKRAEMQELLEKRKDDAFKLLDEAETFTKRYDYDNALESYRKAELILNEIQYPTESIKNMVLRVSNLKVQKDQRGEYELQRKLEVLEEQKAVQNLIEERQRQEREKKLAQHIALQKREKMIQEQVSAREAAYALLEEAGRHLKRQIPDYDTAISMYVQARNTLAENVGWEPEINNINSLIKDLQQEKANFEERKRLEEQARFERQEEYEIFQEELRKRKADVEQQKSEQRAKYREFEEQKLYITESREDGMKMIDDAKKYAKMHQFQKSYELFDNAIKKFKEIGWTAQIRYIDNEINNVLALEERVKNEEAEIQRIQEELEKQRGVEADRRERDEKIKKKSVQDVGALADQVAELIMAQKAQAHLTEQERQEKLKQDALTFSKNMGSMITIKTDLLAEIAKAKEQEKEKAEEAQKEEEKGEIDEITRMIREAAKKGKK